MSLGLEELAESFAVEGWRLTGDLAKVAWVEDQRFQALEAAVLFFADVPKVRTKHVDVIR